MLEAISIGYSLAMADEHLIVVVRFQIKQPPGLAYLGDEPQPLIPLRVLDDDAVVGEIFRPADVAEGVDRRV